MSANIQQYDRQQGIKQAWHGLTQIVEGLSLQLNWLRSWEIVKIPLWMRGSEMIKLVNAQRAALGLPANYTRDDNMQTSGYQLVASDNPDCLIGKEFRDSYRPISNVEFLGMLEKALEGTQHKLVSIGTVCNRAKRFATFDLSSLGKYTAGGREFQPYLNAMDFLDKTGQIAWNLSQTCIVCDNTFTAANLQADTQRARHTKNVMTKVNGFSQMIQDAVGVTKEFALAFESLATQPVAHEAARQVYAGFIGQATNEKLSTRAMNQVDELETLFRKGRGNRGESRADLFSGVTDYFTHGSGSSSGINRMQRTFESSEFGNGARRKADFWTIVNDDEAFEHTLSHGAKLLQLA
jgi:uncharacterized protein DUF932